MELKNIKLDLSEIPSKDRQRVKKALDDFALKGSATISTSMLVKSPGVDYVELFPVEELEGERNLSFTFEFQSLPGSYFVSYSFGGVDSTSTLVRKLSSPNGGSSYVEKSFRIYSRSLDVDGSD